MDTELLEKRFSDMGTRVKIDIREVSMSRFDRTQRLRLDVSTDKKGEFFVIEAAPDVELHVVDVSPELQHILLMERRLAGAKDNPKYLMGHDERHLFVSEVPATARVKDVKTAIEALKPREILSKERYAKGASLKTVKKNSHRNKVWKRQGEWFFVPVISIPEYATVLTNEPLQRNANSKPHICAEMARVGGETVYVSRKYPDGLKEEEYKALQDDERKRQNWQVRTRNPEVYVRGKISHPDHATLTLKKWHRVYLNRELVTGGGRAVGFLD